MISSYCDYLINSRTLTTIKSIEKELALQPLKNYLFDLSYLGILEITGEKAVDFLQGQLTCDMRLVSSRQITQGAQCNIKGRIMALMDVIFWEGVKLLLPKDLIESTLNSLNKTATLSRVSLRQNKELSVLGFYLQNSSDIVPDTSFFPNTLYAQTFNTQLCYYHLGEGFYIFLVPSKIANNLLNRFHEKDQLLGSLPWHTLRLTFNQIDIYLESRGLFLPHRLELHQTQCISFNKGCYKGQEIIARMHYKSILKHHVKRYVLKTDQKIYSGQKLFKISDGTEIGELIDLSLLNHECYLVVVSILKGSDLTVLFEGHLNPIEVTEYSVDTLKSLNTVIS